jgi:hypothetical protein
MHSALWHMMHDLECIIKFIGGFGGQVVSALAFHL